MSTKRKAASLAAEEWLEASGVGELLDPDDFDTVADSLVDAFLEFATLAPGVAQKEEP